MTDLQTAKKTAPMGQLHFIILHTNELYDKEDRMEGTRNPVSEDLAASLFLLALALLDASAPHPGEEGGVR